MNFAPRGRVTAIGKFPSWLLNRVPGSSVALRNRPQSVRGLIHCGAGSTQQKLMGNDPPAIGVPNHGVEGTGKPEVLAPTAPLRVHRVSYDAPAMRVSSVLP